MVRIISQKCRYNVKVKNMYLALDPITQWFSKLAYFVSSQQSPDSALDVLIY